MRICAGIHGGRKLYTPQNDAIRPTSDKVRQAIFNALQARGLVNDAVILDAFCGTGALGLEALSQGASKAYFFDKNKNSYALCKKNIERLNEQDRSEIFLQDVTKVKQCNIEPASLVFLDPPYNKHLIEPTIMALKDNRWLNENCFFVIETEKNGNIQNDFLVIESQKNYSDTMITLASLRS